MKRQFIAALVIALAATGCSNGNNAAQPAGRTATASNTPTGTPDPTDAANERLAAAEVDRVIGQAAAPPGSARLDRGPSDWPPYSGASPGLEERMRWYAVPGGGAAVHTFLRSHPPAGLKRTGSVDFNSYDGMHDLQYLLPLATPPSAAFTLPTVHVRWRTRAGTTVLQYDAVVSTRHARVPESFVHEPVTRVVLDRVPELDGTGLPVPRRRHLVVTDPGSIARLVAIANGLPGSTITLFIAPCPYAPPVHQSVRFNDRDGTVVLGWIPGCFGQIDVVRNGKTVGPTLDPSTLNERFDHLVR